MSATTKEWLDGLKLGDEVIIIQTRPGCNQKMVGYVVKILKNHIVISTDKKGQVPSWKVHKVDGHEVHRPGEYWGVYIAEPTEELHKAIRIAKKIYIINGRAEKIKKELINREWTEEQLDEIIKILDNLGL